MKFSKALSLALVPAATIAGQLDNVNAVRRMADPALLVKRAACNSVSIIHGLSSISLAVSKLSSRFAILGGFPPCTKVSVASYLTDADSIIAAITAASAYLAGCSSTIGNCNNVQAYFDNNVKTIISSLSNIIIAKSAQVSCNSAELVLSTRAVSISKSLTNYGNALIPRLPAGNCRALAAQDIAIATAVLTGIIKEFTPP